MVSTPAQKCQNRVNDHGPCTKMLVGGGGGALPAVSQCVLPCLAVSQRVLHITFLGTFLRWAHSFRRGRPGGRGFRTPRTVLAPVWVCLHASRSAITMQAPGAQPACIQVSLASASSSLASHHQHVCFMSAPGDLDFGLLFAAALDAAPGGMLTAFSGKCFYLGAEAGARQARTHSCLAYVWPWRPSSFLSGPGDLRLLAAALDSAPGGMLTAVRGKIFSCVQRPEPGRDELTPARALEAEIGAVCVSIFARRARCHN